MARLQCEFGSEILSKSMGMTVLLPQSPLEKADNKQNEKFPVLYLLHGFSDNHTIWTRFTSIERYVADLNLAVVMPEVGNSYYTNMEYGERYWSFLTEELPVVTRSLFPISEEREDTFVAGLSMGGFGALKWGLNSPDQFSAIASLSGVTDLAGYLKDVRSQNNDKSRSLYHVFGNENVTNTLNDPMAKLEELDEREGKKPKIFQACGTEDFLYENNQRFHEKLQETSLNYETNFGPGDHNWEYWDRSIQDVLHWLPIRQNVSP
ncbi:esterase family protein [Halobacillus salinarum]|uniref:Esterase family protein n=1 Tax=Halobacillus salinarum TaxID=2932257 RepID=A0ABY4EJ61_9BACI|nr:alpha/beta hydrolase family protein [Halobacillus salinarum]UOQ44000.1 esterase family protein [Halobacillus salinarum]